MASSLVPLRFTRLLLLSPENCIQIDKREWANLVVSTGDFSIWASLSNFNLVSKILGGAHIYIILVMWGIYINFLYMLRLQAKHVVQLKIGYLSTSFKEMTPIMCESILCVDHPYGIWFNLVYRRSLHLYGSILLTVIPLLYGSILCILTHIL